MSDFGFTKDERLKSAKVINRLFKEGNSFSAYPLRLVWIEMEPNIGSSPVQFSISVPKKKFKSAVVRNRIRRRVREAWRLNKNGLYARLEPNGKQLGFMVLFTSKEELPSKEIQAAMKKMIAIFLKKYKQSKLPLHNAETSPSKT